MIIAVLFSQTLSLEIKENKCNNNYLLNGNKVQLYSIELNTRLFISRATKEREK